MPTTKTAPEKTSAKPAAKSRASEGPIQRTAELSDQVLQQVETGQRSAIDAIRKFVGSVDGTRPGAGDGSSRPREVIDSVLEMSDRLVHTQYDFVRNVVRSTRGALSGAESRK